MEHRVVVRAVDLVVWRTVIVRHVGDRTLAPKALAHITLPEDDCSGLDAICAAGGAEMPAEQEPRHVGFDNTIEGGSGGREGGESFVAPFGGVDGSVADGDGVACK